MKNYKLIGIEYYIINATSLAQAVLKCLSNKIGVMENNLEEFNDVVPDTAIKVIDCKQ